MENYGKVISAAARTLLKIEHAFSQGGWEYQFRETDKKFIKIQEVRYYTKQERVKICTTKSYINKTVMVNFYIINAQIGAWK